MYEIFLDTINSKFTNNVINVDPIQTILYLIINFLIAFIAYKIFNLIGEKYSNPSKTTKHLMNFFIFSSLYFFASGLFEMLSFYYSIYQVSNIGVTINFSIISLILFTFYFLTRYYLFLSIYIKFSKNKENYISEHIKNFIKIGIILDFSIFFYLWYTLDYIVIGYNLLIFSLIYLWITRHRKQNSKTVYRMYLLLLILIFSRINFIFLQSSYSEVQYLLDIIVTCFILATYYSIYLLLHNNRNILEKSK